MIPSPNNHVVQVALHVSIGHKVQHYQHLHKQTKASEFSHSVSSTTTLLSDDVICSNNAVLIATISHSHRFSHCDYSVKSDNVRMIKLSHDGCLLQKLHSLALSR